MKKQIFNRHNVKYPTEFIHLLVEKPESVSVEDHCKFILRKDNWDGVVYKYPNLEGTTLLQLRSAYSYHKKRLDKLRKERRDKKPPVPLPPPTKTQSITEKISAKEKPIMIGGLEITFPENKVKIDGHEIEW